MAERFSGVFGKTRLKTTAPEPGRASESKTGTRPLIRISIRTALAILAFLLLLSPAAGAPAAFPGEEGAAADTVTVAAGKHYLRGWFHRLWWGRHYRREWAEPVQAEIFSISSEKGGLKPLQMGGSFQTKNLRLEDSTGREYVLRSIDKNPTVALPENLQNTFLARIMQDQTSVIHPYGAFIVPTLAKAAQVYHTTPRLVFIPDDPALGPFQKDFANTLALFEERPDDNWEDKESFGFSTRIRSSRSAFRQLYFSQCTDADARQYLRSRLFDMWIGDWSRREDQWRWATFRIGDLHVLEPIPRDRDHAFFLFDDGILTKLITLFKPNYQSFHRRFGNLKALNEGAAAMDEYLLVFLSREDFRREAEYLQQQLTDEVIREALQVWPPNIYALSGEEFFSKLQERRKQLAKVADSYYKHLAKKVEIPGTDEPEHVVVERLGRQQTKVTMHRKSADCAATTVMGERIFNASETKRIRIYGLGGDDNFELKGKGKKGLKVQLYGGAGEDQVNDSLGGKKVQVYQAGDGDKIKAKGKTKVKSHKPRANEFDAEGWLLRHRLH